MGVKVYDGVKFVSPNGLTTKTMEIDNSGNPLFDSAQLAKQSDVNTLDSYSKFNSKRITNIVSNGDFSNGTTGWSASSVASFSVSDSVASILASAVNGRISQPVTLIIGNKYYASAKIKADSTNVRLRLYDGTNYIIDALCNGLNTFGLVSAIGTATNTSGSFRPLQDTRSSNWTTSSCSYAILIDLTATFGAGNEPTKAQVDAWLNTYPNSWFGGTVGSSAIIADGSAPIYACRAWVNFNGTGTVAIRASGNVSSITDNGTGDYTVNFTTAMPDANYSVITGGNIAANSIVKSVWINAPYTTVPTGSAIRLITTGSAVVNYDSEYVNVAIFR